MISLKINTGYVANEKMCDISSRHIPHTHLVHDLTTSDAFVIHYFVVRILTKRGFLRNRATL